jgi:hypothetical protein
MQTLSWVVAKAIGLPEARSYAQQKHTCTVLQIKSNNIILLTLWNSIATLTGMAYP